MRSERVAFLLDWTPRNWDTRCDFHLRLCRALRERDILPVLTFPCELSGELQQRFLDAGIEVQALNYGMGCLQYYSELRKLIRRYSITMVHIRFFPYFSLVPWLSRLSGVRNILYTEANSGEATQVSWKTRVLRMRAKLACGPLTRLIAVSAFTKRRLSALGIREDRISVVHNGIDHERFTPDPQARERLAGKFPIAPGEFVVAAAFNLLPWKHPEILLQSCGLLAQRGVAVRVFLAGDGPLQTEIVSLSRKLGISDRTHLLGQYSNVETLFQACDVSVLPSVGEAFGNVVAEAMACGVPVIASRSGASEEIIEHGRTGLLAEPRNPGSFADALQELAGDTSLRKQMGVNALERARKLFTLDRAVGRTIDVYESTWKGQQALTAPCSY